MLKIKEFTIDYKTGGIGIDTEEPTFSWKMTSDRKDVLQASYRLSVKNENNYTVFDSGIVQSGQSVGIKYTGEKFEPQTEYRASVEIIDNYGDKASAALTFETGLMGGKNFSSVFIAANAGSSLPVFKVFKRFSVDKKVIKARAYATALGMYSLKINGENADDRYFAPGWTSYNKMLQYQTYDVTSLLKTGGNEVALTVAEGWYSGRFELLKKSCCYGNINAALCELHIFYKDGTKRIIETDSTWKARRTYITASNIFNGEKQDFTQSLEEVYETKTVEFDKSKIIAQLNEPCRVTEKIKPVKYIKTPKGENVLDFGQNCVGVIEIKVKGKKGQIITLKHAEILDAHGNFYTENLRSAKSTDVFILSGGEQILSPRFTFHGFRYLMVTGTDIVPENYTALVIHSDMKSAGVLETSNALINRLFANILWGQRGNFVDIPTDCPQRDERLGWTGDINVFARTATFNYDVALFLRKWLMDVANDQKANGEIPVIIPDLTSKDREAGCLLDGARAMWSSAVVMVPWTLYQTYGDIRFIAEPYLCMKKYVDMLLSIRGSDGLIKQGAQYADWLALDGGWTCETVRGATDHYYIANVFCLIVLDLFVKTAKIIGNDSDGKKYSAVYDDMLELVRREYFTVSGRMVTETQTACSLALYFHIAPQSMRPQIVELLKNAMDRHNGKLTTGFIGSPFLCFALSDNGLHEYAEKLLLNEEFPGWLYPIKLGATTIWERWNSLLPDGKPNPDGMNSYNHYAYGSVGEFYWRRVVGIDNLEPGYKRIRIQPHLIKGIDSIRGEYESVYGTVASGYEKADGKIKVGVKIPANTTAEIVLPGRTEIINVGSGEFTYEYTL